MEAFTMDPLPQGWGGVFAAIPFAIWFFLAIEGVANVAEETINRERRARIRLAGEQVADQLETVVAHRALRIEVVV